MGNTTLGRLYKDGETIIKQGTIGDCVFVIQKGKVEVIKEKEDKEVKVAELGEKEFFGEMALFEKDVRSCTIRAKGDAHILTLDKKNFYNTIQKDQRTKRRRDRKNQPLTHLTTKNLIPIRTHK